MPAEKQRLLAHLRALGIGFLHLRHGALWTMQDCVAVAEEQGALYPKNVFLCNRAKNRFYLCVMRPERRFASGRVSKQAGSARLSFAPDDALLAHLHVKPGAVTPLALLLDEEKRVGLLVDAGLKEEARLCFHPLTNEETVVLDGADFFGVFLPSVGHDVTWINMEEDADENH